MVTQKPICLKIDTYLLEQLDEEVRLGWRKRNWHINQAIALYLEVQDLDRRAKFYKDDNWNQEEVKKLLRKRAPHTVY